MSATTVQQYCDSCGESALRNSHINYCYHSYYQSYQCRECRAAMARFGVFVRGRIRTFLVIICCLVLGALYFNLAVSTAVSDYFVEESENELSSLPPGVEQAVLGGVGAGKTTFKDKKATNGFKKKDEETTQQQIRGDAGASGSKPGSSAGSAPASSGSTVTEKPASEPAAEPPPFDADINRAELTPPSYRNASRHDAAPTAPLQVHDPEFHHDWSQDGMESHQTAQESIAIHQEHENDAPVEEEVIKTEPLPQLVDDAAIKFANRWCDLRGVEWFPVEHHAHHHLRRSLAAEAKPTWQQRAPYVLLPGATYSGTSDIALYLERYHSTKQRGSKSNHVIPARSHELAFFYQHNFRSYVSVREQKTKVLPARHRMWARDYHPQRLRADEQAITLDATSGYLFYSSILPRRILCVMPWIQVVIILRNPVDRIVAHYTAMKKRGLSMSLEAWIDQELTLMRQVGLIGNATTTASSPPTAEMIRQEDVAWYEYQSQTLQGALGRSMYAIQLRHWFQGLRAVGRAPEQSVLLLFTEDVAAQPQEQLRQVAQFLNLGAPEAAPKTPATAVKRGQQAQQQAPIPPLDNKSFKSQFATLAAASAAGSTTVISPELQQRLEAFFKPYNKRLRYLLARYRVQVASKAEWAYPKQQRKAP